MERFPSVEEDYSGEKASPTKKGQKGKERAAKHKWTDVEEKILHNIIHYADNGALKRILVDNKSNVKMSKWDAWERVRYTIQ